MSGIGHAVGKVFKGIGHIIKKIWKPLLIAVAIYFTAGAAAAYFGAAEAAGGAAAFAGAEAGAVGSVAGGAAAAAGGAAAAEVGGAAIAADIGAGAAADAGAGIAADIGAGATASGVGTAATGAVADLTAGSAIGSTPSLALGPGADLTASSAGSIGSTAANPGATSSWWDASLHTAGQVLKTPGVMQMIGSGINSFQQGQMYNENLKWMAAHAPGQIQGGVPQGIFSGYAHGDGGTNPNIAGENVAAHGRVAPVHTSATQPNLPGGITSDPSHLPGMNQSAATAPYPGYGIPGYGQQSPGSGPPPISQQVAQQPQQQSGLFGGAEMPYVESPYDQSIV